MSTLTHGVGISPGAAYGEAVSVQTTVDAVSRIWEQVLEVQVGPDTDFFDVGGHSFLAMRIVALLGAELSAEVPVTLVFDHPRLGDFAAAVAQAVGAGTANPR
ncbi:acyl carrier protein [Catenulispora sp. GP43]|uniref:phosphopantetheine-binding protein n=1 Tax=Catenulispora sp. GP43 TaxID=3156263 RepID=UPI003518B5CF